MGRGKGKKKRGYVEHWALLNEEKKTNSALEKEL